MASIPSTSAPPRSSTPTLGSSGASRWSRTPYAGGGRINGFFLAAGCIDELSLLVAPIADGAVRTPTLFDAPAAGPAVRLQLVSMQRRGGGLLWLRYRVRRS